MNKNTLKIFFGGMSLGMIGLVILTSMKSNLFALPACVVNEPWFQTTLVDFYFNIAVLSTWVCYKESNKGIAFLWIIAFIILGSIATAFYVLLQLLKLNPEEHWGQIFLKK